MKSFGVLGSVLILAFVLSSCRPPSEDSFGHRDARSSKPFWELNDHRDN